MGDKNSKNNLEKTALGLSLWALTIFSQIFLPGTVVNYYESKKDYYINNPKEINYILKTPGGNAESDANLLGIYWGGVNLITGLGAYHLVLSSGRRKKEE